MEGVSFLLILLIFLCGILFNVIWGNAVGLGYGSISYRNSMIDSLLLFAKNIQSVHEIQQLKYMHYELLERDEKYINFQKMVDERELTSIKNTIVRNYINSVPKRYMHMIKFEDWNSAMLYLNKILKERSDD